MTKNHETLARLKVPIFSNQLELFGYVRKELSGKYDEEHIEDLIAIWDSRLAHLMYRTSLEDLYVQLNEIPERLKCTLPLHVYISLFDINLAPKNLNNYFI